MTAARRIRRRAPLLATLALLAGLTLAGLATAATTFSAVAGSSFTATVATGQLQCEPPSNIAATITWGDGSSSAGTVSVSAATATVKGTHTYANAGSEAGTVNTTYDCGSSPAGFTSTFTANVTAPALSAQPVSINATTGRPVSGPVATFTSTPAGAPASAFIATIAWGDGGAATAGTVTAAPGGGYTVTGTHTYATQGRDPTTITITGPGPSTATASGTALVELPKALPLVPHVRASFTVGTARAGGISLDASGSAPAGTTAARYEWTLPGTDVVCPASEPQIEISSRAPVTAPLTLTAVDTAGTTTTATRTVSITAPTGAVRGTAHGTIAAVGVCGGISTIREPALTTNRLDSGHRPPIANAGGAPPAGCADDLVFGAADIHGCLDPIPDPKDLPGGISLGLGQLLCSAHATDFCLSDVTRAAAGVARAVGAKAAATGPLESGARRALAEAGFPSYYSYSAVRLDGVDIVPQNGSPLLFVPSADAIVGSSVRLFLHNFPLTPKAIPFGIYVPAAGGHLGDITLPKSIPIIGTLPFTGSLSVDLHRAHALLANGDRCQYDCASIAVQAALPGVFSDSNGHGVTANAVLTADAVNGLEISSFELTLGRAQIAGIGVENVDIHYQHVDDSLHVQATFDLFEAGGNITGTLDILHGGFQGASVNWDAGDGPGIDLGGPLNVYLVHLGGGISLDPTTISANGRITGGPQALGCSLVGITGNVQVTFSPFSFDADADGELLCQKVAHEFFHYDDSGYFHFGGNIDIYFGPVELSGGVDVQVDVPQGHFQFDGNASACLDLYFNPCVGAEAVVSDRGIGVCADLGFTHAGAGVQFPDHLIVFFDTCDIGKFRSLGYTTAAGAGPGGFTVSRGEQVAVLGVTAASGAPHVKLVGPDGRTIDTPADGYVKTASDVVFADSLRTHTTYFFVNHPAAGTWKVEPDPGSVPVTGLRQAASLPDPAVHAHLGAARGGRERLAYTLHPLAGQTVTFAEQGTNKSFRVIGTARGARGALTFTPSLELPRRRAILAMVTQDGHPRSDLVVARFTAPRAPALPAPHGLKARRTGDRVTARWRPVAGAATYLVTLVIRGGGTRHALARTTQTTLAGVPLNRRLTVTVTARRRSHWAGAPGRPARSTLAAGRLPGAHRVVLVRGVV